MNRWLLACLGLALGLVPGAIAAQIAGDADGNGRIGPGDVTAIIDTILQIHPAPGNPDCTLDSHVDVLDVICVQRVIAQTAPTISEFLPTTATAGTLVTVHGSHFAAGGVPPTVTLARQGGGALGAPVMSSGDDNLVFVVPSGAAN